MLSGGGQHCSSLEMVEEVSHPEPLSGCPALFRFRKDSFLLFPIIIVTFSQERKY